MESEIDKLKNKLEEERVTQNRINSIKETVWAQQFKILNGRSFNEALKYASTINLKVIVYKTEINGILIWVVEVLNSNHFWMDSFNTKKEAVEFCKQMSFTIVKEDEEVL